MSAAIAPTDLEVLPPRTAVAAAVKGPGQTVIDASTGSISYEHKSASLLLAEAVAVHDEAVILASCIDSQPMYEEGANLLKLITDSFKTLDEERLASTAPLRDKVDEINKDYKPAIEKRKAAADLLKGGLIAYDREIERQRQIAEREAQERAAAERRRAEAEAAAARKRAEEEAAAVRKAAEEKAAEERRVAEEAAAQKRAEAEALASAGDRERAAQLQSEAANIVTTADESVQNMLFESEQAASEARAQGEMTAESHVAVASMITPAAVGIAKPRAAGVSTSTKYFAKVVDPKAFAQFCVDNWDTMGHYLTIEQGKLNTLAQNQKERFRIAGCELETGTSMSARRR